MDVLSSKLSDVNRGLHVALADATEVRVSLEMVCEHSEAALHMLRSAENRSADSLVPPALKKAIYAYTQARKEGAETSSQAAERAAKLRFLDSVDRSAVIWPGDTHDSIAGRTRAILIRLTRFWFSPISSVNLPFFYFPPFFSSTSSCPMFNSQALD